MKVEPMTDTQIKTLLQPPHLLALQTKQLILRWIHAEARARKLKHKFAECEYGNCPLERDGYDWIAAVKREVGWVED